MENQVLPPKEEPIKLAFESFGLSQVGYTPDSIKVNQDAFSINTWKFGEHTFNLYIVCDGHGKLGEKSSNYCINEIPGKFFI